MPRTSGVRSLLTSIKQQTSKALASLQGAPAGHRQGLFAALFSRGTGDFPRFQIARLSPGILGGPIGSGRRWNFTEKINRCDT